MAEEKREAAAVATAPKIPPELDVNAKWDACTDLAVRRVFYSTLSGAFAGLLLFREPPLHSPFFFI